MKLSDFDYNLPKELVAQYPQDKRDRSRLMVLDRESKSIKHHRFKEIIEYLKPGDVLVVNKSKVIPARLLGNRVTGGKVEVLLLDLPKDKKVKVLTKSNANLREGEKLIFNEGELEGRVYSTEDKIREFEFCEDDKEKVKKKINKIGHLPLPPYIDREAEESDVDNYQTVYAKEEGSIASPTAGLHFTPSLLQQIKEMGVRIVGVILHISYATFNPVREENVEGHHMHKEYYQFPKNAAEIVTEAKRENRRIVAVGTTSCRVLETVANLNKVSKMGLESCNLQPEVCSLELEACKGWTDLFIYPPYNFRLTDALITNFHLPKSTLLMLVSAFGGRDFILYAYQEAIKEKYRFYSYGDCMMIE